MEDHLNGVGFNILAINVNGGECDASGRRSIYRRLTDRPTDRLKAGEGKDSEESRGK